MNYFATLKTLVKLSLLEFFREKVVWIFIFVAGALYGLSLVLGALSFSEKQRILSDFGWMSILVSNLGIVLFLGSSWLQREMTNQTCLMVLARPVSRVQFYFGKFLGIWILSFILQALMALSLWGLLQFDYSARAFFQIFVGTFLEVSLILSLSFFAATFLRSSLAFLFGFGLFLIGHWMQEIEFFGRKSNDVFFVTLGGALKWVTPNLFQMNWRNSYFLENGVPLEQIIWVTFHSTAWILFLAVSGIAIFRRRDLV